MLNLSKMIERYFAAAEIMGERIRDAQRSAAAANLIGKQIVAHPDFQKVSAEMQQKFRASQVSAAEILKGFEGFNQ